MTDEQIHDWDGTYVLVPQAQGTATAPLSTTTARARVARWMHQEPQRSQLRRVVLRYEGILDESVVVGEDALFRALFARLESGRLCVSRAGLARETMHETPILGEGEDTSEEGEVVDTEPQIRPCDFETLVIKCKHMPADRKIADARFWRANGNDLDNLPAPRAGRAYTKVIEVIASDEERKADDISIALEGGPGYTCGSSHPKITVRDLARNQRVFEGQTSATFKAVCRALPPPPDAYTNPFRLILYYFFPTQAQNVYTIDVESCGRLDDGSYGFGRSQQKVRAYPSDKYKLKLEIPALKKKTFERGAAVLEDGTAVDTRETSSTSGGQTTSTSEKLAVGANKVSYEYEKKVAPIDDPVREAAASFSITRDGKDLKGTNTLGQFINTLVNLQNTIQSMMNFIRDFQPQVGWKFVFELELFKGELEYEWGYKEWEDHTVYEWWKFGISMTLFALMLELRFGADFKVCGFGITVVVFGKVEIDAKVAAEKEASPADSKPWELVVASEPKGALGIRSALGADWVKAEGKLTVGLKFEAKCKCSTKEPFHIDWQLDREPVKAVIVGSVKWVGSIERSWTLVDGREAWQQGRFPGADPEVRALPGQRAA